jgi:hypothetical protein
MTGRWIVGVALATLTSLASAGEYGAHGGGHFGGGGHGGGGGGGHAMGRPAAPAFGPRGGQGERMGSSGNHAFSYAHQSNQGLRAPRSAQEFAAGGFPPSAQMRAPAMRDGGWHGDGLETARYGGGITPVSAETRSVPHPPADAAMVRAGSIREDVARYNEERSSRSVPRPPDEMSRPPGPSPYRN